MFYNSNNWNLIAEIIFYLSNHNKSIRILLPHFKALSEESRGEMLNHVVLRLKECGFPRGTKAGVFDDLISGLGEEQTAYYLMEALCYIDKQLIHQNEVKLFMQHDEASVSLMRQLNTNAEELGIIVLPKLYCCWSRKGKTEDKFTESSLGTGINELMQYYYYVNVEELGGYSLVNYMMKGFRRTESHDFLRIAVSPLTNGNVLAVKKYEIDKERKIGIAGVGSEAVVQECGQKVEEQFYVSKEELESRTIKVIEAAAVIQADILMFPEMLGTKEMITKGLKALADLYMEEEKCPPILTLLPTVWECRDCDGRDAPWEKGNNTNTLYAACGGSIINGTELKETFSQQKQVPYLEKTKNLSAAVEDIISDKQIHVLHIPNLGRIAFPICADLLDDYYREMLIQKLGATLILCPSFSKGFDDFIQRCNAGNTYGCRIVWCNSCAVRHLYGQDSQGVFREQDICCTGAWGQRDYKPVRPEPACEKGCCSDKCLFYIDIPFSAHDLEDLHWRHQIA